MTPVSNDMLRYSCQLALPGFGETRQRMLAESRVLIVGAGGLGCPVAQYLTAAGIGTIGIADDDKVSLGNLHRQILYTPDEVGLKKVVVAAGKLSRQNPAIRIVPIAERVTSANVMELFTGYDIIVDGTDNFETRYLLNDAAVLSGKPLVYGAIYQYEGQVSVWNAPYPDGTYGPNYRDVFPDADSSQVPNCAEGGVIPTLAGMIGCLQANEVIKYLAKTGELLSGRILLFDAETMESRNIKLPARSRVVVNGLPQTFNIPLLSPEELRDWLREGTCRLIDVRGNEEREVMNIGGEHIPLAEVKAGGLALEEGQVTVFYCASGKRSAEAVKYALQQFPLAEFYSLDGGIKAWVERFSGEATVV